MVQLTLFIFSFLVVVNHYANISKVVNNLANGNLPIKHSIYLYIRGVVLLLAISYFSAYIVKLIIP